MARLGTSSSGGIVSIQDTNGNPISSTDGAIDVNVQSEEGFSSLASGSPGQIAIGTTSAVLIAANVNRKYAHIVNNSSEAIFIQYSSAAALNQGIKLWPGTLYTIETNNLWLGTINAIGLIPNQLIDILEGE